MFRGWDWYGMWLLATHSQKIVGGFSVRVTPKASETAGHITLPVSVGRVVTSLLPPWSGVALGHGQFWCEQVVMEGWNSDSLSLTFFSHPFFSSSLPLSLFLPLHVPALFCFVLSSLSDSPVSPHFLSLITLFFFLSFSVWDRTVYPRGSINFTLKNT